MTAQITEAGVLYLKTQYQTWLEAENARQERRINDLLASNQELRERAQKAEGIIKDQALGVLKKAHEKLKAEVAAEAQGCASEEPAKPTNILKMKVRANPEHDALAAIQAAIELAKRLGIVVHVTIEDGCGAIVDSDANLRKIYNGYLAVLANRKRNRAA